MAIVSRKNNVLTEVKKVLLSEIQEILPCLVRWEAENSDPKFNEKIRAMKFEKMEVDPTRFVERLLVKIEPQSIFYFAIKSLD